MEHPSQEQPHLPYFPNDKNKVNAEPTWRDNKTALWFVRAGFIFQFYIPMLFCCVLIYGSHNYEYTPSPVEFRDGVGYGGFDPIGDMMPLLYRTSIFLLVVLVILCSIFTLILRLVRHARGVLSCLIGINVLLIVMTSGTMLFYLILPALLYLGAIAFECDM